MVRQGPQEGEDVLESTGPAAGLSPREQNRATPKSIEIASSSDASSGMIRAPSAASRFVPEEFGEKIEPGIA